MCELDEVCATFESTLADYSPEFLGTRENGYGGMVNDMLQFLLMLINLKWQNVAIPFGEIAEYLPSRRISFGFAIEIRGETPEGTRYCATLSVLITMKKHTQGF